MSTPKEVIFEQALKEILTNGNPGSISVANRALELAKKFGDKPGIQGNLLSIQASLRNGLLCNGEEWTFKTDDHIRDAQREVDEIFAKLAQG